jgi:hypothetical protein
LKNLTQITLLAAVLPIAISAPMFTSPAYAAPFVKICNSGQQSGSGACPASPVQGPGANQWGCTRDNASGLLWEIKRQATASAPGNMSKTYTNYDDVNLFQKTVTQKPTQAEIAAATNTMGYVNAVNVAGLCGQVNWRRPTRTELQTLVNGSVSVTIDPVYFPNTVGMFYWTSTPTANASTKADAINFADGMTVNWQRNLPVHGHLRLVAPASTSTCQTLIVDESKPWNAAAAITLPGAPKKVISVTGSYTVAAGNGRPAQTLSINPPPPNQPRTGPFNLAYQNKHIFSVMLIPGLDMLPPAPGAGYPNYVTVGQPVRANSYLHHATSLVSVNPSTQAIHNNVTGSVTICVG